MDSPCLFGGPELQEYVLASSEKLSSPEVVGYDFNQGRGGITTGPRADDRWAENLVAIWLGNNDDVHSHRCFSCG